MSKITVSNREKACTSRQDIRLYMDSQFAYVRLKVDNFMKGITWFLLSLRSLTFRLIEHTGLHLWGQSALALRLLLAVFSYKISAAANHPFGDEFRAARRASEEIGAQIVLGDRPIEITLKRAWSSLNWKEKLKLLISLFRGISSSSRAPESNSMDAQMDGGPYELYKQLSFSYPSLLQPLIHERDTYLAWSLKRSKAVNNCNTVVGIIGKGHMNGVIYALITDQGNLRFRDVAGRTSSDGSNGWVNSFIEGLVRDTILGFIIWAIYEQLKIT